MKKNLILMMLLLAGAVSVNGQIVDGPIMVVTGSVVNTGTLVSKGPIDLRTNPTKDSQINNTATGDIKTPALTVGEFTLVNNEGNLCVGCEEGTPCLTPAQPGITGKDGSSGQEVTVNETSLIYSVTTPVAGETYTWSSDDFSLPEIKTGNSITVTAPAAAGPATITVTPSNDCDDGTPKNLSVTVSEPSYPAGSVVIDTDVRTGFISGTHGTLPTTTKSGKLLVYPTDGNSGSTKTWNSISGYNSTSYANTDASKFVGANAGCEDGWRLPSAVEIKGIMDYFQANFNNENGPTSEQVPGFTRLNQNNNYWTSTYTGPYADTFGIAWCKTVIAGLVDNNATNYGYYVRCVLDF
jgi:hypothetical protein